MPSVDSIIADFKKQAQGTKWENSIDTIVSAAEDKNIRASIDAYFNDKTQPAIVRVWKDSKAKPDQAEWKDMVVLFPIMPASDRDYYDCESVGWDGHGAANPHAVISSTRKATPAEIEIALENLSSEERNVKVDDREQPYFIRAREINWRLLRVL